MDSEPPKKVYVFLRGLEQNRSLLEPLPVLLSPYAPHLAEELWELLGNEQSIAAASWPEFNEEYLAVEQVQYSLLINGKVSRRPCCVLCCVGHEKVMLWRVTNL